MVTTRGHPNEFSDSDFTPSKATRSSARKSTTTLSPTSSSQKWAHTPSNLTLLWLTISLPLVVWDALYVLLRPHSMPGGALHWPLWVPYELYGRVDHIYGWKAYNAHNGFTAAQTVLNVVETALYAYYAWCVWVCGVARRGEGRGAPGRERVGVLGEERRVEGGVAGRAVLVAFGAAVMTVSKTVLYWMNEHFSGWDNVGHNDIMSLIFLWIIPNGAWLVFPSYMIYVMGAEILQGLDIASGATGLWGVTPALKSE